jgi:hypothetical protein
MRPFLLPLILLALLSCRSERAERGPNLFGNLYVRYLQEGSELKAQASFFEGDSAHRAAPKSISGGVTFQGGGMEKRNIQDKIIRYQYEGEALYPKQFRFQAQDDDGRAQEFTLEMDPIASFSIPDTIYNNVGATLELEPAFQADLEELVLLFTDSEGKASIVEIKAPVESKVALSPAQLSRLSPGPNQLYLVKKQNTSLSKGAWRITGEVEFYSNLREVFVKAP